MWKLPVKETMLEENCSNAQNREHMNKKICDKCIGNEFLFKNNCLITKRIEGE